MLRPHYTMPTLSIDINCTWYSRRSLGRKRSLEDSVGDLLTRIAIRGPAAAECETIQ